LIITIYEYRLTAIYRLNEDFGLWSEGIFFTKVLFIIGLYAGIF